MVSHIGWQKKLRTFQALQSVDEAEPNDEVGRGKDHSHQGQGVLGCPDRRLQEHLPLLLAGESFVLYNIVKIFANALWGSSVLMGGS